MSWPKDASVRKLTHNLSAVLWVGEERCQFPTPCPLPSAGRRAGPGVMRVGELALPLIGHSILEKEPCILPASEK